MILYKLNNGNTEYNRMLMKLIIIFVLDNRNNYTTVDMFTKVSTRAGTVQRMKHFSQMMKCMRRLCAVRGGRLY